MREVDARIDAREHEQAQVGERRRPLVAAGGGEDAVATERGLDVDGARWPGLVNSNPLARPIPDPAAVRRAV